MGVVVRKRLVFALAVLVMTLVAVPFGASAAAPNIAQVSATTWQDTLHRGVQRALLVGSGRRAGSGLRWSKTTVKFSGTGSELGGNGTGTLELSFDGTYFSMYGTIVVNGVEKTVEGYGEMYCLYLPARDRLRRLHDLRCLRGHGPRADRRHLRHDDGLRLGRCPPEPGPPLTDPARE